MGFYAGEKEVLAGSNHHNYVAVRGSDCNDARLGSCTIYLYAVLISNLSNMTSRAPDLQIRLVCCGEGVQPALLIGKYSQGMQSCEVGPYWRNTLLETYVLGQ